MTEYHDADNREHAEFQLGRKMIRFCDDCLQERKNTSWIGRWNARLCLDCEDIRCEAESEIDAHHHS